MSFSHGMRPRLVVRESRFFQGVSLLVLLAFGSVMLFLVFEAEVPVAAMLLLAGTLVLFVLIQIRLLRRTFRSDNWLMKFFSHGIALQTGGYATGEDNRILFIPAEALRTARVIRQSRVIIRRQGNRTTRGQKLYTSLEIEADKTRVESVGEDVSKPIRRLRARFLHEPVTETDEGYRLQLHGESSRVAPSVRRIAEAFRQFGIQVRETRLPPATGPDDDAVPDRERAD